jgi:hypothetical protein
MRSVPGTMRSMPVTLIACSVALAASSACAQSSPPESRSASSMLKKVLDGDARLGRNGVPVARTEARAVAADQPSNLRHVYITDEYGFTCDSRGNRIR